MPPPEPDDPCAAPGALPDYDLPLHLAAVLVLLCVSMAGSLGPVALRLSSGSPAVSTAIRLGTYFGFGTILATAFIHMLLPASEAFRSPCLPRAWRGYDAWAFLFATAAVLAMQLVDYVLKGRQERPPLSRSQSHVLTQLGSGDGCHAWHSALITALSPPKDSWHAVAADGAAADGAAADVAAADGAADGAWLEQREAGSSQPLLPGGRLGGLPPAQRQPSLLSQQLRQQAGGAAAASQVMGLYLAEAGIIFHSMMIGLMLGVTGGSGFKTLLVALSFHQFFEGFAIGSASVDSGMRAAQAAAMGCAFSVTTPAGIAVGIALRASFNERAGAALLASAVCDALSAGVLIYTALCELMSPVMTDSRWLRAQSWPLQAAGFLSLYAGAAVMAAVGAWA